MNQFNTIFNKFFPIVIRKSKFKNLWYDNDLHDLQQKKQYLFRNLEKRNLLRLIMPITTKPEIITFIYFKPKKLNNIQNFLKKHKQDIKGTWKVINNTLGRKKQSTRPDLKLSNQLSSDLVEISYHFNHRFASVASKLVEDLPKLSS